VLAITRTNRRIYESLRIRFRVVPIPAP
jgi:hypothetical protein